VLWEKNAGPVKIILRKEKKHPAGCKEVTAVTIQNENEVKAFEVKSPIELFAKNMFSLQAKFIEQTFEDFKQAA
jgi:hypothetical protein